MSILDIDQIIAFPGKAVLGDIFSCSKIDIVSPYFSSWSLRRLVKANPERVRLITKLPDQFTTALSHIDNDPRPLKLAMEALGKALDVYAFPEVHAKLYINQKSAWLGSSNLSANGFSGKGELMVRATPPGAELKDAFKDFRRQSVKISLGNVEFLISCIDEGLTKIRANPSDRNPSGRDPIEVSDSSFEDFQDWIWTRSEHIRDAIENKNRMKGHVWTGFHGVKIFLLTHPRVLEGLVGGAVSLDEAIDILVPFIREHGHRFAGRKRGVWNTKLSVRMGGTHSGGGAGDVMVKRLLPAVAQYLRSKEP